MLFFILLPIASCLANVSSTTQPPNVTVSEPQDLFIWPPPPTLKWLPRFTQHHHHQKPFRPLPTFGPKSPFSPFPFFPDHHHPSWFHNRHKRFHPPHHHHGHHHHDHHHDFHPHYDFHHPFFVNEMIPTKELFKAEIPYQRKEDQLKSTNLSEIMELDSMILSTMEHVMSEKKQTQVEILKSIEMEYDPVLKKFVQKREEGQSSQFKPIMDSSHSQKKRSDAAQTSLFTQKTKTNLQNVLSKFEKEQMDDGISMRDKKNFQTGRFKFKHGVPEKLNIAKANSSKNNLLELICNVKSSGPKIDSIPSATVRADRFSRNANYYKWSNSDLSQRGDSYTDWDNNSISVYIDDPKFFNFLHGNWSKGGVPIMLTATNPNNHNDHKNCNPPG